MATFQLSNFLATNLPRTDVAEQRLSELAQSLAYDQAKTTLESELLTTHIVDLEWMDLSSVEEDLPAEAIAKPLEYLGLRRLLHPHRNHPNLFRVLEPISDSDILRPSDRRRIEAGMRAAAQAMMSAGRRELAESDIAAGNAAMNAS